MNVLVFDIQTAADIDGARRLYDLHGLSDDDVVRAVLHKQRQLTNSESLPIALNKIVAISTVWSSGERFKVWSLGDEESSEQDLLQRFYDGIERYTPQLVSWNGKGFALPVIHYRSLQYPLKATRYWEMGQTDKEFADNNYQHRYHQRHVDLMDVLSAYNPHACTTLQQVATLCGFPGMTEEMQEFAACSVLNRDIGLIQAICETNVLNAYLVYLNWERNRGHIAQDDYLQQCKRIRHELKQSDKHHLIEFEKNWIDY